MAAEFELAPVVQEIAEELIPKFHSHLVEAKIVYLFRVGSWESKGRTVYGKAYRLSGKEKFLSQGYDFAIVINKDVWVTLQPHQQKALVDHELCHCGRGEDDEDGNPRWCIWEHDVEEFRAIIDRHGLWHPEVRRFAETASRHVRQQTLFDLIRDGQATLRTDNADEQPAEAMN